MWIHYWHTQTQIWIQVSMTDGKILLISGVNLIGLLKKCIKILIGDAFLRNIVTVFCRIKYFSQTLTSFNSCLNIDLSYGK
jgi:hypothetical protein